MKTILNIFLYVALNITCMTSFAQDIRYNLAVWAKDGTKVTYTLAENPNITFTKTDLIIKTNTVQVSYSLEQMLRITYEKIPTTDVVSLEENKPFIFDGESLLFNVRDDRMKVSIASLDGKIVFSRSLEKANTLLVPLKSIGCGVFVVCVNGVTYKIAVK